MPCAAGQGDAPDRLREIEASLRWMSVPRIGAVRIKSIAAAFDSLGRALAASGAELAEVLGCDAVRAEELRAAAIAWDPRATIDAARAAQAEIVPLCDDRYPALLRAAPDPPPVLFVRGALAGAPEAAVALVGSRRASGYGRLHAGRIACELAELGVAVVSGGARGIDAEAHRGALRAGGRTIAVVATGSDRCYPPDHGPLFDAILGAGGAVVTEHPCGIEARPEFFPRRNRVIAALSLVVVVIEAAERSGALVTARIAVDDLSREVGCLPGPVDSVVSSGCHRAIREGWAQLVTGAEDIARMLAEAQTLAVGAIERTAAPGARARGMPARLGVPSPVPEASPDAGAVLAAIRAGDGASLDEILDRLGWPMPRLAPALLELEVAGSVRRGPEGRFLARADLRR